MLYCGLFIEFFIVERYFWEFLIRKTDYMNLFFPYLPSCTLDRCRHYWFCAHVHVPWGHGFAGKVRCILDNHTKTSLLHGPSNDRPGQNYLKNVCHIPRKPRVCFHQNHVQPCVSEIEEEKIYCCTKLIMIKINIT